MQCGDAEVERTIEDKVHRLGQWVDRNPGKRVTVALSFFEKRYKQNWFAKHEERLYWEQWRVHLDVKPQEADPQPGMLSFTACDSIRSHASRRLLKTQRTTGGLHEANGVA